ncbi:MAG: serine--tRNA ligase, partial [Candidatus Nanohaloarchaea archaeon]|nr:serine--tRNA ligase [Candidatus Nanohaloarchaea archaeon]
MLDIQLFRDDPERIKESERRRGKDPDRVDRVVALDEEWRATRQELDELRQTRNEVSDEIAELKRDGEDAEEKIQRMQEVKEQIAELETEEEELRQERDEERYKIGNLMHESVPDGADEEDNEELSRWEPDDGRDSDAALGADIMEEWGLLESERAVEIAGERAYFLKGDLLQLNQALIRFGLDFLRERGWELMQTPYMMNHDHMRAAAELEDFHEQLYHLERDDRYLIATSEQPLAAHHFDELLQPDDLPRKYGGFSTNFRREAGKHGEETRGLWRVHRFDKVEQFIFCEPDASWEFHDQLLANEEEIMQMLGLPYRVVNVCAGDLGDTPAKKYDIEVWRPPLGEYGEVTSCSNCTDYQARKVQTRVRRSEENEPVHTLNATLLATGRIITAIMENNQTGDGRVEI